MSRKDICIQYKNQIKDPITIRLTGSKSECNRALLLQALSQGNVQVKNISDAHDTQILEACLQEIQQWDPTKSEVLSLDIGPAGTAMRFLTAYLSLQKGSFELTGTTRMQERPIGILVNALSELGASIQYKNHEGYPPLIIQGGFNQNEKQIAVQGNISSQYLSALLLIGAKLPMGLELEIVGQLTSKPYLDMTISLLKTCGIQVEWEKQTISISPQEFSSTEITIEPDWSAASYWYCLLAVLPQGEVFLPNLKENSLQGDRALVEIMEHFGIVSQFKAEGLYLKKTNQVLQSGHIDFLTCPDIAQSIIVLCAVLKLPYLFSGLETLKIKETNRITALQKELQKIKAQLIEQEPGQYYLDCSSIEFPAKVDIETYEDHRMAMAFAILATQVETLCFDDREVVQKSYPNFWIDLEKFGFLTT